MSGIIRMNKEEDRSKVWFVPEVFQENILRNIYDKIERSIISKEMIKAFEANIKGHLGIMVLSEFSNSDTTSFYETLKTVQAWQKEIGLESFEGNEAFFDEYISECDHLITMIEKEIKERVPEYYTNNIANK